MLVSEHGRVRALSDVLGITAAAAKTAAALATGGAARLGPVDDHKEAVAAALRADAAATADCEEVACTDPTHNHDHSHAHASHADAEAACTDPTHDHDHGGHAHAEAECTDPTHDHSHGDDHDEATCTDPTHDHSHSHNHASAEEEAACTDPTHDHSHNHNHAAPSLAKGAETTAEKRFGITSFVCGDLVCCVPRLPSV